ncbi:ABC transporter permease [Pseudoroseomonas deserti]|uniref:ABC transporter permease n=1 Tax=Teichococcus deserti TaxID=1817963 RepID=A0A1V2H0V0_9PROT|nr:ABC transporter permease [Pseudoroseomonas deserti]ONG50138.1 ABC transporter permease [Pseudoroseomonas deserti]
MDFAFLSETFFKLLAGFPLTVNLAVLSLAGGGVLALLLNMARASGWLGARFADFYVFLFRGSPLLIQIFLIYYGLGNFPAVRESFLWPFLREPYWCALLALILNDAAYTAEILRGGFRAVPRGAVEAAEACGMSRLTRLRRITLPVAIRQALPAYSNEVISMFKSTALASTVTLMEVTGIARAEVSATYRAIEIFLCAAVLYLVSTLLITRALRLLETRLSPWLAGNRA